MRSGTFRQTRTVQEGVELAYRNLPEGLFPVNEHSDGGVGGGEEEHQHEDVLVVHRYLVLHVQVDHQEHLDHPHLGAQGWAVGSVGPGLHVAQVDGEVDGDGHAAFHHHHVGQEHVSPPRRSS